MAPHLSSTSTTAFEISTVVVLFTLAGLVARPDHTGATPPASVGAVPGVAVESGAHIDHRYRIVGKARLLFWTGADDVGSARLSWRRDGRTRSVSLLIGSEPQRAPRGINQWGYIQEKIAADAASVFGIRSMASGDTSENAQPKRNRADGRSEFGVLCSSITATEAASRTAAVLVNRGATYRDVDQVLDAVATAHWTTRRISRPSDVAPGFLTALDLMMHASVESSRVRQSKYASFSYVYKDAIYDLTPRRVEHVEQLETASGVFRNLLRADISLRNRTTRSVDGFSIVFGIDPPLSGVPVFVKYQPNWLFKIELALDDNGRVPPDPEDDSMMRSRMAAVCTADRAAE